MTIEVKPYLSPRIITVPIPATSMTMQDLANDIRDWEQEPWNMTYKRLLSDSGKQDLGGSVYVGITNQLEDAKLAFEARTTSASQGTATSADPTGKTLIDSAATFQDDGVTPGACIINFTDKSVGSVISVDSQIQITHEILKDGTGNDWGISDEYKIWNVVQCDATGGNITAIDSNGVSIPPIYPTAFTQVVKTSSSSATLQELSSIQYSSFAGGVWIDEIDGTPGTTFPTGTPQQPVDNYTDAMIIAEERGFDKLYIDCPTHTFHTTENIDGYTIIGKAIDRTTIIIEDGCSTDSATFEECSLSGTLNGNDVNIENCFVDNLSGVNGYLEGCIFRGKVTLSGSGTITVLRSFDGIPGAVNAEFDCGGSGRSLEVRDWFGGLKLSNKTGPEQVAINFASGRLQVAATCTGGTITVRGIGDIQENLGTATLIDTGLVNNIPSIYGKTVYIDSAGTSGTSFPIGTWDSPVNNIPDALIIVDKYNLTNLHLHSDLVVPAGADLTNRAIEAHGSFAHGLTFESGCITANTIFKNIVITGELNGDGFFEHCFLEDVSNIEGNFKDCMFNGTIQWLDLVGDEAHIVIDGGRSQTQTPVNFVVGSAIINATHMDGAFNIQGKDTSAEFNMHCDSGTIVVESSCTAGTIYLSGYGTLVNNSGGATVVNEMIVGKRLLTTGKFIALK